MVSINRRLRVALCSLLIVSWPLVTGSLGNRTSFDSRILAAHNRERSALGLPMLRWNQDLAVGAKQWSDRLARTGRFEHSPNIRGEELLGENIWGGDPDAFSPENMVGLWLAEKRNFQPGTFPRNSRSGNVLDVAHYTQLIWSTTDEVGCALTRGAAEEILVCRYRNPGNVIGQNVY